MVKYINFFFFLQKFDLNYILIMFYNSYIRYTIPPDQKEEFEQVYK
jgi:hypothetical protein